MKLSGHSPLFDQRRSLFLVLSN
uniref:Uncharacterized protein n=1 Tax=Rhizophora mucronata TaxID=61149 RepID=A0A2P2PT07_RHIMU